MGKPDTGITEYLDWALVAAVCCRVHQHLGEPMGQRVGEVAAVGVGEDAFELAGIEGQGALVAAMPARAVA